MSPEPPTPPRTSRARTYLAVVVVNLAILLALEGLASTVVVVQTWLARTGQLSERVHTRYDAELGWVNIPNLSIPDLYGPGRSLHTNAQGFRNRRPTASPIPPGKVRLVCSGDSFTLGYGVADEDAWCNHLEALDPRIDPVNMGQGGYGIDQAYLWYRRDGSAMAQDVHVFAFITVDFGRMRDAAFLGYPKPVLALEGGKLVSRNVPVPRRSEFAVKLREAVRTAASFRSVQLLQSWLRPPKPAGATAASAAAADAALQPVVSAIFRELAAAHRQRGSVLVLAYLPMKSDYAGGAADDWRRYLRDEAARQQIAFVDLVEDLRAMKEQELDGCFIKPGELVYGRAEGHYTARGNDFISRVLYRHLLEIAPVAARLDHAAGRPGPADGAAGPR